MDKQIYITIPGQGTYPPPPDAGSDPWATFPDKPPSQGGAPDQGGQSGADPWAAFPDKAPTQQQQAPATPQRTVPTEEAVGRGLVNSASFGFAPAIAGLAEASGIPSEAKAPDEIDVNPIRPLVGGYKMIENYFADHPDEEVKAAYERGRNATLGEQNLASEQHPYAYLAGQLGGAIAAPGFGAGAGASVGGRLVRSAIAGGVGGGLGGAGEATSEGKGAVDIAKSAAANAGLGAAFGGSASGVLSAAEKGASKVASIARGAHNPEIEASRRVVGALGKDFENKGAQFSPETTAAAHAANTPLAVVDAGGENTRALARSAANTSADARQSLTDLTQSRFENQTPRIAGFIREFTGGSHAAADTEAIQNLARKANDPAYARAYQAGSKGVWSPELQRLAGAPSVQEAIRGAVPALKDRGIVAGYKLPRSNPFLPNPQKNGAMTLRTDAKGNTVIPELAFWDQIVRNINGRIGELQRGGNDTRARDLVMLKQQLTAELDKLVPTYKGARAGASAFFKAEDALEAGQKFVTSSEDVREAASVLRKMTDPERELFARGFASELANRVEGVADRRNVLNAMFLNSEKARTKIRLALGPQRSGEIEALLRAETLVDEARKALGNSTTARQLKELGLAGSAGAGAVAGYEELKGEGFNPGHVIAAALTVGAARKGAHIIDERVARRVGEMLASNDPSVLAKGVKIVARDPKIVEALRRATGAAARVGTNDIGPQRAVAAGGALAIRALEGRGQPTPDLGDQFYDQQQ